MAIRSTNTQEEALGGLIQDIASIKMMPDADVPFLINLETIILDHIRSARAPQDPMAGAGGPPPGMGGPPPGMGAGAAPGPPTAMGGGLPGVQPGGAGDELRRMLQQ